MLAIMSRNRKIKSLTLIEIMVVLGISMLLIGVSIPLFGRQGAKESLHKEAEAIASFYSRAQNYSFHPEREDVDYYSVKPDNCIPFDDSQICKKLVIYANNDDSSIEVDSFVTPRAVFDFHGELVYQLQSGRIEIVESLTVNTFYENNLNEKISIILYPTGVIDVQI